MHINLNVASQAWFSSIHLANKVGYLKNYAVTHLPKFEAIQKNAITLTAFVAGFNYTLLTLADKISHFILSKYKCEDLSQSWHPFLIRSTVNVTFLTIGNYFAIKQLTHLKNSQLLMAAGITAALALHIIWKNVISPKLNPIPNVNQQSKKNHDLVMEQRDETIEEEIIESSSSKGENQVNKGQTISCNQIDKSIEERTATTSSSSPKKENEVNRGQTSPSNQTENLVDPSSSLENEQMMASSKQEEKKFEESGAGVPISSSKEEEKINEQVMTVSGEEPKRIEHGPNIPQSVPTQNNQVNEKEAPPSKTDDAMEEKNTATPTEDEIWKGLDPTISQDVSQLREAYKAAKWDANLSLANLREVDV
jgi:hypothetical protein